jgi:hypothetical protein
VVIGCTEMPDADTFFVFKQGAEYNSNILDKDNNGSEISGRRHFNAQVVGKCTSTGRDDEGLKFHRKTCFEGYVSMKGRGVDINGTAKVIKR